MSGIGYFYIEHDGNDIVGLQKFTRSHSLYNIVGTASFSIVDVWDRVIPFKPNKKTRVFYVAPKFNGKSKKFLVCDSFISNVKRTSSSGQKTIDVTLVDDTSLLFDCSWINEGTYNGQYENSKLLGMVNSIVSRYMDVFIDWPVSLEQAETSYSVDNNSTPFDSIKDIADKYNFLLYKKVVSNSSSIIKGVYDGRDLEETDFVFKWGQNVKSYDNSLDYRKIFSEYNATGQGSINEYENISDSTSYLTKQVIDDSYYRPTSISSSNGVNQSQMIALRIRKYYSDVVGSNTLTLGIYYPNASSFGELLQAGQIVKVEIGEIGAFDRYVITDVSYNLNEASVNLITLSNFSLLSTGV